MKCDACNSLAPENRSRGVVGAKGLGDVLCCCPKKRSFSAQILLLALIISETQCLRAHASAGTAGTGEAPALYLGWKPAGREMSNCGNSVSAEPLPCFRNAHIVRPLHAPLIDHSIKTQLITVMACALSPLHQVLSQSAARVLSGICQPVLTFNVLHAMEFQSLAFPLT